MLEAYWSHLNHTAIYNPYDESSFLEADVK